MTMYAGLVLGGLFFAIVFCTVITIEDIKEIYNECGPPKRAVPEHIL